MTRHRPDASTALAALIVFTPAPTDTLGYPNGVQ